MHRFLLNLLHGTAELAPFLLLGMALSGIIHFFVPKSLIERHLSGKWGVVKAVALGVPLPLCSCGVIPAGLGLRKHGASEGATVGFLISTPQTGVDSILVSAGMLGWPFALFKVATAAVTGLVGGAAADVAKTKPAASTPEAEGGDALAHAHSNANGSSLGARVLASMDHSYQVIHGVWGWLLGGILVSAAVATIVKPGQLAPLASGHFLLTAALVIAFATPLYVCATASVPLAAALVHAGVPTGIALIFLLVGPATNLSTMGAVYRGLGKRAFGVYMTSLVLGSVGAAWIFQHSFATPIRLGPMTAHHAGMAGISPLAWLSIVALALLLAYCMWQDGSLWLRTRFATAEPEEAALEVTVSGLTCQGCVKKLTRTLLADDHISEVKVELEGGQVQVRGSSSLTHLHELVRSAGFEPKEQPA